LQFLATPRKRFSSSGMLIAQIVVEQCWLSAYGIRLQWVY